MTQITELPTADLRAAGDAIETLIDLRAYLPPSGMLIMLAGKLRDDIRDMLRVRPLAGQRGPEVKLLGDLEDTDLDRLDKAVGVLLGRFTRFMDDPEMQPLLTALQARLAVELFARAQAKAARRHDPGRRHRRADSRVEGQRAQVQGHRGPDRGMG